MDLTFEKTIDDFRLANCGYHSHNEGACKALRSDLFQLIQLHGKPIYAKDDPKFVLFHRINLWPLTENVNQSFI